jgi:transcriptional regulator with XRE-family HTH domain
MTGAESHLDDVGTFGPNIRAARLALNVTQAELGEAVGISTRHLRRIEHGEVNPHSMWRYLLAHRLGGVAADKIETQRAAHRRSSRACA